MKILLFGDNCASCKATIYNIVQAAQDIDTAIEVEECKDLIKMVRLNILQTPAVVIDECVLSQGKKLSYDDAKQLILQHYNK
ncbi:MAG: thioredoxin family protein [Bacteroidales bacterium]|nr:thioredoxin family protein [Bacteroidales bacterium]